MLHYINPCMGIDGVRPLWNWPVTKPVQMLRAFGADVSGETWASPLEMVSGKYPAVDIGLNLGSQITSPADGVITWAGDRMDGRGIGVEISSSHRVMHGLFHLGSLAPGVKAGREVNAGAPIGYAGKTGFVQTPTGRQMLRLPMLTWYTAIAGALSPQDEQMLRRFHSLPSTTQAAGGRVLRSWLEGRMSADDVIKWIVTMEQKGQSAQEADDGLVSTTRSAVDRQVQRADAAMDRVTSVMDKTMQNVEAAAESGTMLAVAAGAVLVVTLGIVGVLWSRR